MIVKERLEEALTQVRNQIAQDVRRESVAVDFLDSAPLALRAPSVANVGKI
jgi:hypothetical protein